MRQARVQSALFIVLGICIACVVALPTLSFAQESELSATIRAALLADPETANLSQAELDAMVAALSAEAETQGVAAGDILWQPQEPVAQQNISEENTCVNMPPFLCALNESLGFAGGNTLIPLWLFISSAALLFTLWAMIQLYRKHHLKSAPMSSPTPPSSGSPPANLYS